jgi:RimJ/RimL family protein N-acetyltransferase
VRVQLRNGLLVTIRPIRPDDKTELAAGLERLSPESRRRRFLTAKPRFTSGELRYLTEVDGFDHVALVAEAPDGHIIGVGRFVRLADNRETAEFAIVVGDAFQRQGLGRALAARLADEARAHGVGRFAATALSDNVAVQRLLHTIGARLAPARRQHGVDELVADLAA